MKFDQDEIDQLVKVYSPLLSEEEKPNAAEEWLDLKMYIYRNENRGFNRCLLVFLGIRT